jgi:predicted peroxiredoxin
MNRLALGAAALAAALAAAIPVHAQQDRSVLSIVTSGDPQTQLMSMVLTMQTAAQGLVPHVLLCGPAGDIALKGAPETATAGQPPRDASPQGLMRRMMEGGATVEVCAIYLPGRGEDASVLLDGVGAADPAEIGALLADPDVRVLSF